ncbi:alpha-amylase family glycosyl hydrolase [Fulvivirga ligni]|uniref:alpha-amylase family glycosyl hydrolase n=1 Tax=Fulvivirga ligni TaxID=2904246 RepID=UPI001F26F683|nr:alpha-amylase family glycosyl hydrolase [Fulvivirga ligni]UII18943.1 alpha-amylase [Fulvivirga ligni]
MEQEEKMIDSWPKNGLTYEIFVQSYCDSNDDGIGDIKGMESKLDYLQHLGVEAVWLMPIMPSPSYHKYDVTDYKAIHPDYGTIDDFKAFVDSAHQHNIKVVIDLIINHTSDKHPWFLEAIKGEDNPYRDYFVWANKDSIAEEISKKETTFDSDNIQQWHAVNGDEEGEHYYGFFTGMMPDLNYDNPKVREEVYDIGKFWLSEVGVDGFRLDAAKHIYPDDRAEDSHAFWEEFQQKMQEVKPDVYLVGEVWANTETQAPYAKGFSALFNFDLAYSILNTVNEGADQSAFVSGHSLEMNKEKSLVQGFMDNQKAFQKLNKDFILATFLSNHDQNRVMSVLGDDPAKAKVAASILLTLPGAPYLYYGEEIGMKGMKPDENIREPFLWDVGEADTGRTSWMEAKFTTEQTVAPLSVQSNDPNSVYNHYLNMIHLRRTSEALTNGSISIMDFQNPQLVAFVRQAEGQTLYVVHNISADAQELKDELLDGKEVLYKSFENEDIKELPAYSTIILK